MDAQPQQNAGNIIARHPLISFYVLAYAISWIIWVPLLSVDWSGDNINIPGIVALSLFSGQIGPFLASIIVTGLSEGKSRVKALLKKLILWRVPWPWYLVAILFLPLLTILIAVAIFVLSGRLSWSEYFGGLSSFALLFPTSMVATMFIGGPLGEELGWRGYAVPRLQQRTNNALTAAILHGVLWACWHLPVMGMLAAGVPMGLYLPLYIVEITALSVLMSWLLNHTRGSVLLAMLMHSTFNVGNQLFARLGATADDGLVILIPLAVVYWVIAIIIVLVYRPARLSRKPDFSFDDIVQPQ